MFCRAPRAAPQGLPLILVLSWHRDPAGDSWEGSARCWFGVGSGMGVPQEGFGVLVRQGSTGSTAGKEPRPAGEALPQELSGVAWPALGAL